MLRSGEEYEYFTALRPARWETDGWMERMARERERETERVQLVASVLYNTHKQMDTHTKQMDTGIQTETHTHTLMDILLMTVGRSTHSAVMNTK